MSKQKENVIREKRTIEATKKNLMGPSGKFGIILQAFGTPIIRQGTSFLDSSFLSDPFEDYTNIEYASTASGQQGPVIYRDEILMSDIDNSYNEGLLFDGLSRGMHIEITYWHHSSKLQVYYKGYLVYLEMAGELEAYAPTEEWENLIEKLVKISKERIKLIKKQEEEEIEKKIQENKKSFVEKIKRKWAF
jgi:hypothetical protein